MTTLHTAALHTAQGVLAAGEGPNPLIPHTPDLIVGIIAFALLYLFLRAKVFPMFEKAYADRTRAIEGGMAQAQEAQEEAQRALEQYRAQLAEARHDSARLREEAREQGTAILAEMRENANAESRRIVEAAHQQIAADRQQAFNELRSDIGRLATELAGRIVGESVQDGAVQRRLIDRFLDDLDSANSSVAAVSTGGDARAGDR